MSRPLLVVASSLLLVTAPLAAQRELSVIGFTGNTTGHARADADPDRPTIAPDHPVSWQVALGQEIGAWRGALLVRHARADLAIRGAESAVLTRSALRSWGASAEAGRRLAGRDGAPTLHALVGVGAARTTFPVTGGDPRTVVTGHLALLGRVPIAARWRAMIRAEGGLGGALFDAEELPPGYSVRAGREWSLGIGLGWRP